MDKPGIALADSKKSEEFLGRIIMMGIYLMTVNYLIYNFFQEDKFKDVVRIVAVGIIIAVGLAHCARNGVKLSVYQITLIYIAVAQLFLIRDFDINFLAIVLCAMFSKVEYGAYIKGLKNFTIVLLVVVILSLSFGWVENVEYISTTERLRRTLGFENVNAGSLFFFSANLIYLLNCKKIKFTNFLFSVIYSVIIYKLTDTRTSIVGLAVFFVSLFLTKILNNKKRLAGFVFFMIITVLYCTVFLWDWIYVNFPDLDEFFSSRLHLFSMAVDSATLKHFLIGGIDFSTYELFVDNFYILLLFQNGIFIYITTYLFAIFCIRKLITHGLYKEVALIISLLAVGLVESSLIRPEVTCVMVAWRCILDTDYVIESSNSYQEIKGVETK